MTRRVARTARAGVAIPCHYDMFEFNTAAPTEFAEEAERLGQRVRVLRVGGAADASGRRAMSRDGWTERAYADSGTYLAHRARSVARIGPLLEAGDTVLDLACGDAAFAEYLPTGVSYLGVDDSAEMADAARARGHDVVVADLNDYVPPQPVAVTTCFRAVYYARDRRAFFGHVAGYTRKKFVFDLNPRQYDLEPVIADLRSAGFSRIAVRPFFSPQRVALPSPVVSGLRALEGAGPIARLLLRKRFTYICAAVR